MHKESKVDIDNKNSSNRAKIRASHRVHFKNYYKGFLRQMGSYTMVLFVLIAVLIIVAVEVSFGLFQYIYKANVVEKRVGIVQNEATLISAEYANYASLALANSSGMTSRIYSYSALNEIRIRVVDTSYRVTVDSYSVDADKVIINSKVFNVIDNPKNSSSGYDETTGNIEAVVPVYNNNGETVAALIVDMPISEVENIFKNVEDTTDTIKLGIIVIALIALFLIISNVNRPVKKTLKQVHDISLGHTDMRIDDRGYSEKKAFSKDFNAILDKAMEMDASRSEFVSNVSHELKTPITSIKVLAESINSQDNVPIEIYQEFMQDIVGEIDRESKIIEDLLSLVRLDKKANQLNLASISLNELLELVLRRLKPLAEKKNIEVLFESFRPVVAEVDEVKITQVLSNLVENAIKYNNDDGWVHVSLNADHQYFYIRVEDSGIGIPEESQDKIFERFYRVDKARSRETGGTGLGLAIVRNIILLHHGTIKVHSEEGIGTTFTLRIPLNYVAN